MKEIEWRFTMFNNIRYGLVLSTLLLPSITLAEPLSLATMGQLQVCSSLSGDKSGLKACDVNFTFLPTFLNQCTATNQGGIYTIRNNTPVTLRLNYIRIASFDALPASATAIVTAPTNPCGASLAAGASCNIQVNLQPLIRGTFNRVLQVGVDTRQVEVDGPAITTAVNCGVNNATPLPFPVSSNINVCEVLAATPVLSNTGATQVTGNICITPAASFTGWTFNASGLGVISGSAYFAGDGDPLLAPAKADTQTLYTNLQNQACTNPLPGDIGGQVLTQAAGTTGVYCFATTGAITGTLTFSGAGNFIIQVPTALTTAAGPGGSIVTLINGASSNNIYFAVGTAATLGTSSVFQGRLIASAGVTIGTSALITSPEIASLTAAVTLDTNMIAPGP
jgi:hypothetical protein